MHQTEQSIQQRLIESVPATAQDAVLFRLGSLQGVVSLESHAPNEAMRPVVTVYDPQDDLELKAVIGSALDEAPDLDDVQQVQALVIDGVARMVEQRSLHDATIKQITPDLEGTMTNA